MAYMKASDISAKSLKKNADELSLKHKGTKYTLTNDVQSFVIVIKDSKVKVTLQDANGKKLSAVSYSKKELAKEYSGKIDTIDEVLDDLEDSESSSSSSSSADTSSDDSVVVEDSSSVESSSSSATTASDDSSSTSTSSTGTSTAGSSSYRKAYSSNPGGGSTGYSGSAVSSSSSSITTPSGGTGAPDPVTAE